MSAVSVGENLWGLLIYHEGLLPTFLMELGERLVENIVVALCPPLPRSKFTDPRELWSAHTFQPGRETDFPRTDVELSASVSGSGGDPAPNPSALLPSVKMFAEPAASPRPPTHSSIRSFNKYLASAVC